jgi:hypothetical protein
MNKEKLNASFVSPILQIFYDLAIESFGYKRFTNKLMRRIGEDILLQIECL